MPPQPSPQKLTENGIDKAESFIRDAKIVLDEFEKLVESGFTWWVRFTDRDYAGTLAGRFENFLDDAKEVPGSTAWFRLGMDTIWSKELPKLDELLRVQSKVSRRKLRQVVADRRNAVAELEEFYSKERHYIRSRRDYDRFSDARRST